jgi:hypothetical protein
MDRTNITIVILISLIILISTSYIVYLYIIEHSDQPNDTSYVPVAVPVPDSDSLFIKSNVPDIPQIVTTDKLNIPIVKEIKFGNIVIPKPPCLYGQVYNDKARKCVCPQSTHALINKKCVEVKCNDGYIMKKSGVGKNGNYLQCMKRNGESKIILVENLDPK